MWYKGRQEIGSFEGPGIHKCSSRTPRSVRSRVRWSAMISGGFEGKPKAASRWLVFFEGALLHGFKWTPTETNTSFWEFPKERHLQIAQFWGLLWRQTQINSHRHTHSRRSPAQGRGPCTKRTPACISGPLFVCPPARKKENPLQKPPVAELSHVWREGRAPF